jgi:hypothetical protein
MISTLILLSILTILFLSGYAISNILYKKSTKYHFINSLFFGFVFIEGIYNILLLSINHNLAYQITILITIILILFSLYKIKSIIKYILKYKKFYLSHLIINIICLFIIAWPMFIYDNFETYYHSGALDLIEDVFRKAQYSMSGNITNNIPIFQLLIQYTSSSLWMKLFDKISINIILIQYLALNTMMYIGIYIFSLYIIKLKKIQSTIVAIFSTINVFYATCFINYHGGTMIVLSLIFFILFFILKNIKYQPSIKNISLLVFLLVFLLVTYRFAAPLFFLFGIILLFFHKYIILFTKKIHIPTKYLFIIGILLYISMFYLFVIILSYLNYSSYYFTNILTWDYPGYRQWELFRSSALLMFEWGLIPSLIMGKGYLDFADFYTKRLLYYLLVIISIYISYLSIKGLYQLSILKSNLYLRYNTISILLLMPIFILLLDPYFTYKLFYLTFPFFIIGLVYYISNSTYKKYLLILLTALVIMNQKNLFLENKEIFNREYNKIDINKYLLDINKSTLENSYLDIPGYETKIILNNYLHTKNIYTKELLENAKYILYYKNQLDIINKSIPDTTNIFENKYFKIYKKRTYLIIPNKYIPREQDYHIFKGKIPIRIIYDSRNHIKHKILARLYVQGYTEDKELKYIQIILSPDYSVSYRDIDVHIKTKDSYKIYHINGLNILWLPIKNKNLDFMIDINTSIKTRSLFPIDQRDLFAKILNINIVKEKYNKEAMSYLNENVLNKNNELLFANGWYPLESKNFRWASNNVEILVKNTTKDNLTIQFDIQPGYSLQKLPLKIEILNNKNKKIGYIQISKRQKIKLNIPVIKNTKNQIIKLKVLNKIKKFRYDSRDLNFRLFSMKAIND